MPKIPKSTHTDRIPEEFYRRGLILLVIQILLCFYPVRDFLELGLHLNYRIIGSFFTLSIPVSTYLIYTYHYQNNVSEEFAMRDFTLKFIYGFFIALVLDNLNLTWRLLYPLQEIIANQVYYINAYFNLHLLISKGIIYAAFPLIFARFSNFQKLNKNNNKL